MPPKKDYLCSVDGSVSVSITATSPEHAAKIFTAAAQDRGHDIRVDDVEVSE